MKEQTIAVQRMQDYIEANPGEENYIEAIMAVQHAMDQYDPKLIGYEWDDTSPRTQFEPRGERGYIEMRAVKRKTD